LSKALAKQKSFNPQISQINADFYFFRFLICAICVICGKLLMKISSSVRRSEHALVWKLAQSPHAAQMWCGARQRWHRAGTACEKSSLVECVNIQLEDLPKLLAFGAGKEVDITVVGRTIRSRSASWICSRKNGMRIWGPNQKPPQFESSKVLSQNFMEKYVIPTARPESFLRCKRAKKFAASLGGRCAVKADGLALGKGVLICANEIEANRAIAKFSSPKTSARRAEDCHPGIS